MLGERQPASPHTSHGLRNVLVALYFTELAVLCMCVCVCAFVYGCVCTRKHRESKAASEDTKFLKKEPMPWDSSSGGEGLHLRCVDLCVSVCVCQRVCVRTRLCVCVCVVV